MLPPTVVVASLYRTSLSSKALATSLEHLMTQGLHFSFLLTILLDMPFLAIVPTILLDMPSLATVIALEILLTS